MTTTNLPKISPFVINGKLMLPYHHDPKLSPPLTSMAKVRAAPPDFNGKG
jgi:hypothetical protein